MYSIIRNGEYLCTDKILLGDIQVPEKPHENAFYVNGEWVLDADEFFVNNDSKEGLDFLNSTDWKVIRHQDQLALGIETSLCEEEYFQLLQQRQQARERILTRAESSEASELVLVSGAAEWKNSVAVLEQSDDLRTVNNSREEVIND